MADTEQTTATRDFRLYDTLTRETHPLTCSDGKSYRFYCCGPTVYGPAHIGNFRTFVLQDVFRRVLEALAWNPRHVRNLTNVDDKTIRQSRAEDKSLQEFTEFWTKKFHEDADALNLLRPSKEIDAVSAIPEQIALIQRLIEKGHAYVAKDGSVYYDVSSFSGYGKLSRLQEREVQKGAADHEESAPITDDEYERDSAADFALWKARRESDGPNAWESPWGEGRPGWHTECSAMSLNELGETFDLHSGGIDLIFPHHENEIAQNEAVTGKQFALHWFHIAHLLVEGEKMSKSLGNLFTLNDIREKGYSAVELRYVLISGHYRQPFNFTMQGLHDARKALQRLQRLYHTLTTAAPGTSSSAPGGPPDLATDLGRFAPARDALLEDLNTPEALGRIFVAAREIERAAHTGELGGEQAQADARGLVAIAWMLGLDLDAEPETEDAPEEIQKLAEQRQQARKSKDFATADRLRDEITAQGWQVKDTKDGWELEKL